MSNSIRVAGAKKVVRIFDPSFRPTIRLTNELLRRVPAMDFFVSFLNVVIALALFFLRFVVWTPIAAMQGIRALMKGNRVGI